MQATLIKSFDFDAAHHVPSFPTGHPCRNTHGHAYRVDLILTGTVDPATGILIDFRIIKDALDPLRSQLDHSLLNDLPGLENPTTELLAKWLFDRLKPSLPQLTTIRVRETRNNCVEYHGD